MSKTIVIAEAGVNHNSKLSIAKKMVNAAKKAGADYIKFQIFSASNLATYYAEKAKYQKKNDKNKNETQLKMLKKLELKDKDHLSIINYCKKKKIQYMASVFDVSSLNFIKKYSKIIKIPSGEITNFTLLKAISKIKKKVILSTGASHLFEVRNAIKILLSNKLSKKIYICYIAIQIIRLKIMKILILM